MSEEIRAPGNPRDALKLKLPEPDVSAEEPWADDVLDRNRIAERLTNLIQKAQGIDACQLRIVTTQTRSNIASNACVVWITGI